MEILRLYERGMTAKAGDREGGLSDKRKLLIVEKIKEAYDKSKEKTRSGTWQYLQEKPFQSILAQKGRGSTMKWMSSDREGAGLSRSMKTIKRNGRKGSLSLHSD